MKKIILSGIALSFAAALNASTALADFTVATVGPITGDLAALGEQYKQGATMAVNDINAAGGINGEKLTLEIGDRGREAIRVFLRRGREAGVITKDFNIDFVEA